jgi:hypothetical protein
MHVLSDVLLVGSRDYLSFAVLNTVSADPFRIQDVAIGSGQGPISHQGMITAKTQRAAWWAQSGIYSLEGQQGEVIKEWTSIIKPYITGLSDSRREYAMAGYDSKLDIGFWSVSESGQSAHNKVIAVNFSTNEIFLWTLSRNALGRRIVSGEQRLIGGGYTGFFYNENDTSVFTGSADDATAVIDADVITPRHHCGDPARVKIFYGLKVTFDKQSTSEAVTLQWRLNDASTWNSFAASPYTVTGTAGDVTQKFFPLSKAGTHIQFRFRCNNSGEIFRIQSYSLVYKVIHGGLVVPSI